MTSSSHHHESSHYQKKRTCLAVMTAFSFFVVVVLATAIPISVMASKDDDDDDENSSILIDRSGAPTATASTTMPPFPMDPPVTQQPSPGTASTTTTRRLCNGLENLCDMPVNEILFATMHNANADGDTVLVAPNHNLDLIAGLNAGIRGLNMDIGICNNELSLVHSVCFIGYSNIVVVFTKILQFLIDNANEVILMPIQVDDDAGGEVDLLQVYSIMQQDAVVQTENGSSVSMADLLYDHPGPGVEWPTLAELIDLNQRILFFQYNGRQSCDTVPCPAGFHDWFDYAVETEFQFDSTSDILDDTDRSCRTTRGNQGTRDFFGINMFARIPSEDVSMQVQTKQVLLQHLDTCSQLNGGLKPNLVLVDFWDTGDVIAAVEEYNSALAP